MEEGFLLSFFFVCFTQKPAQTSQSLKLESQLGNPDNFVSCRFQRHKDKNKNKKNWVLRGVGNRENRDK